MTPQDQDLPLEIGVHDVHHLLDQHADLMLLDCREPLEHQIVHLEGALLIPMGQIPHRIGELEPHRERRIVVYCHHGGRSLQVAHWLRQQGFTGVQNMTGGIDAWSCYIDSAKPRY